MKLTKKDIEKLEAVQTIEFDNKRWSASGVSTDSRTIRQGDLFVALRGETFDGHNFLSAAVQAGAAGVVVDQRWAEGNGPMIAGLHLPKIVVKDTTRALGDLARIHRRKFKIPTLAVGGSNGKTTTKEMIKTVLSTKYRVLATESNLNNHIGVPQMLFRLERKHQAAVVELGTNHPGEIASLCNILEPTHGLITNIGREHLEFFHTLAGVANAECELFEWLNASNGVAFVNADDARLVRRASKLKKRFVYGFDGRPAAVRGKIRRWTDDARAVLAINGPQRTSLEVELGIPGEHSAANALAAAAVGIAFAVPPKKIQKGLASFRAVGKRMQVLARRGITILNDSYNSNPDSALAGLQTLKSIRNAGKKIAVLADMLELGAAAETQHRIVGKAVKRSGAEYLLTFGPLSKFTHEKAEVKFKFHYDQKNLLSEYLLEILQAGDAVLIKGSRGMKMEDVVTFLTERLAPNA